MITPTQHEKNEWSRMAQDAYAKDLNDITEINITESGIYANATCGKISACVVINDHSVRVICQNAAHKVWRGAGRAFASVAEAIAAYKTPEMKAIIAAVDRRNA